MIRLRDSLIKMGEELSQAATAEAQQRESSQYYQRRLEELKADMQELVEREAEASRRCMELVSVVLRWFSCAGGFEIGEKLESGASGPGWKPGETRRRWAERRCCHWLLTLGGWAQSGPMVFTPGWSPSSFVSQTPGPASHIPPQRPGGLL